MNCQRRIAWKGQNQKGKESCASETYPTECRTLQKNQKKCQSLTKTTNSLTTMKNQLTQVSKRLTAHPRWQGHRAMLWRRRNGEGRRFSAPEIAAGIERSQTDRCPRTAGRAVLACGGSCTLGSMLRRSSDHCAEMPDEPSRRAAPEAACCAANICILLALGVQLRQLSML